MEPRKLEAAGNVPVLTRHLFLAASLRWIGSTVLPVINKLLKVPTPKSKVSENGEATPKAVLVLVSCWKSSDEEVKVSRTPLLCRATAREQ